MPCTPDSAMTRGCSLRDLVIRHRQNLTVFFVKTRFKQRSKAHPLSYGVKNNGCYQDLSCSCSCRSLWSRLFRNRYKRFRRNKLSMLRVDPPLADSFVARLFFLFVLESSGFVHIGNTRSFVHIVDATGHLLAPL